MREAPDVEERVLRARAGDRAAFAGLLEEHLPAVRTFLFRLGVPAGDLDDLTQEVFMVVIRRLDDYRGASRFSTWLLGIAVQVTRGAARRRRHGSPAGDPLAPAAEDPARLAQVQEGGERLRVALGRLPRPLREAFVLRHVEERPVAETSIILGVPEGTVRRRSHEARQHLRRILAPREATP